MSLLTEAWMPVRYADGNRKWISPEQITESGIVAFDANRADFNGALIQFMIGLLQTTVTIPNPGQWRNYLNAPPDAATLHSWFAPHADAFVYQGNGARFMQDYSLPFNEKEAVVIDGLLIEAPGDNTIKNNTDHFIKRSQVNAMCPHCAVTALLTLQINAPSGGVGHRTGLRGGGPLTTLVVGEKRDSLWRDIWLNVSETRRFLGWNEDSSKTEPHFIFPWLTDMGTLQAEGGSLAPIQVHPAHVFWAMPRRIRIDFDTGHEGECDICGRASERLAVRYTTKNYGLNYKGAWNHPLSPYYETKEGWLPVHPQPGGFGYRHWLAWVSNFQEKRRCAGVVNDALVHRLQPAGVPLRLRAFGYDMDNMKARCWYESTLPLYNLDELGSDTQEFIAHEIERWLEGMDLARFFLSKAVKGAWFGADARGDFSMIDASFWSDTEEAFYRGLKELMLGAPNAEALHARQQQLAEQWRQALKHAALRLFDQVFVGTGAVERQHPRRIAEAHRVLTGNLEGKKFYEAFGLSKPEGSKEKPGRKPQNAAV